MSIWHPLKKIAIAISMALTIVLTIKKSKL
jgi:hypothetical protein